MKFLAVFISCLLAIAKVFGFMPLSWWQVLIPVFIYCILWFIILVIGIVLEVLF